MKSLLTELKIKPLSVNQAWQGRRFKTEKHSKYIRDILIILPKIQVPEGSLKLYLEFGFSSKCADIDNPVKPFIDCLQKKYGFNDKMIKELRVKSKHVKKGSEFIKFKIGAISQTEDKMIKEIGGLFVCKKCCKSYPVGGHDKSKCNGWLNIPEIFRDKENLKDEKKHKEDKIDE